MRRLFWPAMIAGFVIAAVPVIAQQRIADQRELDLFRQSSGEPEPFKRIAALREWEAAYPNSDFQRERLMFFAAAYKESGQASNAFQSAVQMLKLDPKDIQALIVIAQIGPSLEEASPDRVKTVEDAALQIRYMAPELARAATAPSVYTDAVANAPALQAGDPLTERVVEMIREWRRHKPIKTAADVENEFNALAEPALAWARRSK